MAVRRCYVSSVSGRFSNMLRAYVSSVSVVSDVCFNCFMQMLQRWIMMLHMLQWLFMYVSSVYPQCFIWFLYTYVASVLDACLKCFICLLLYVASVASGCFEIRSGCCTCCNGVSTICSKCFIHFRRMLQMFYLDVAKVDRGVARRDRWLSLRCWGATVGQPTWISPRVRGRGSLRRT